MPLSRAEMRNSIVLAFRGTVQRPSTAPVLLRCCGECHRESRRAHTRSAVPSRGPHGTRPGPLCRPASPARAGDGPQGGRVCGDGTAYVSGEPDTDGRERGRTCGEPVRVRHQPLLPPGRAAAGGRGGRSPGTGHRPVTRPPRGGGGRRCAEEVRTAADRFGPPHADSATTAGPLTRSSIPAPSAAPRCPPACCTAPPPSRALPAFCGRGRGRCCDRGVRRRGGRR